LAVLSKSSILELVRSKRLRIEPFNEDQVGAGSIDLHLGSEFRVFRKVHDIFFVGDEADYEKITETVRVRKGGHILVMPGELVHGITREKITLPDHVAAFIEGRSSLARVGLLTHLSSGFIHPGTSNRTVLEIANISPVPLAIKPGTKICQLILVELKGRDTYKGRFAKQLAP
jgi:dCTP deaminase